MAESDRRVDRHIGRRLRERRILLGLSLNSLAEAIGVTYQQLQKYEKGINRVSGGRLHALATRLEVDVSYFYENFDGAHPAGARRSEDGGGPAAASSVTDREALEMMRVYSALEPDIRRSLVSHMRTLIKSQRNRDLAQRHAERG